jgi:ribosome-binding protein aMBF1 (putative translation factor)
MKECFICGINEEKTLLLEVISKEGIKYICKNCLKEENLPIIKKIENINFEKINNNSNNKAYQKLSKITKFNSSLYKKDKIIDSKSSYGLENFEKIKRDFPNLIDNFHWIIMRARRIKHLTQEQLSNELEENENTIKLAEKGILPNNYYELIKKIENKLNIKIFNEKAREKMKEEEKKLGFDPFTTKNLTISDLQEMKKNKEKSKSL